MTVESDLYDRLKTLVSNRVYPDVAPIGTALPHIVYQQIGGETVDFYEDAMASKGNAVFQIRVWHSTRLAAAALARQVESSLVTSTVLHATPEGSQIADYDDGTEAYGTIQDFSIWFDL